MKNKLTIDEKEVFVSCSSRFTKRDLQKAQKDSGKIKSCYFFFVDGDRKTIPMEFSFKGVKEKKSGLMIECEVESSYASMIILGLENILEFLCIANAIGKDLECLNSRKIICYSDFPMLIGISLEI